MSKFQNILKRLPQIASKSAVNHQHGAIVIRNGVPVAWGFNNIKGNRTYHAEHDVIRKYLSLRGIKGWEKGQCILRKLQRRSAS